MKIDIEKSVYENKIELTLSDNISWLFICKVDITKDDFFDMFIRNYWRIKCEWEFYENNIANFGKTRTFEQKDYPNNVYWEDRENWAIENSPEWYKYHWDCNYWRTARYIKFI